MRSKYLRKQRGLSQLRLAMDLSMNQNSISRYENETREADYATLIKLADYFDVSIDYCWKERIIQICLNSILFD